MVDEQVMARRVVGTPSRVESASIPAPDRSVVERVCAPDGDPSAYLNALARRVPSLTHPATAVAQLTDVVVDDGLAELAQVALRHQRGWLVAARSPVRTVDVHEYVVTRAQTHVFGDLMRRPGPETWVLPPDTPARAEVLAHLFGTPDIVADVESLATATLLITPLRARGRAVGLLVLARQGAEYAAAEVAVIERVAEVLSGALDTCSVVAENRAVTATLRRSLVPESIAVAPGLDVATYSRVAEQDATVGGDFVDLHGPDDDRTLLVGDAVGKGVAAAIAAKRIRSAVRTASLVDRDPAFVMTLTNAVIADEPPGEIGGFATALCARLRHEGDSLRVDLVNAGHPAPLVLRADGTVETVLQHGPALGLIEQVEHTAVSLTLGVDDVLLCFTDGVTEARSQDGFFGEDRIPGLLTGLAGAPAAAVVERLALAVADHVADREDGDDIAIAAVRVVRRA
jgi:sigma-B regulation protein RsbU (phosphoserine phosphatase)